MYLNESDCDVGVEDDLDTFSQAMDTSKSKLWYNVMIDEMNSTTDNKVLNLVELLVRKIKLNRIRLEECVW